MESDLNPVSTNNYIFKLADYTNLLVTKHSDTTMQEEFENVQNRARRDQILKIFITTDIVFRGYIKASFL
jgi:hypothetical protein